MGEDSVRVRAPAVCALRIGALFACPEALVFVWGSPVEQHPVFHSGCSDTPARCRLMFTGIIEEVGTVVEAGEGTLRIRAPHILTDSNLGDSIAINGVDLTVAEMDRELFFANLMPETYRRSNLGELKPGDLVNLERSVRPQDRLSGHIVRGVVEGVGTLDSMTPEADAIIVRITTPAELLRYMVVKGPVCIDGISLTIIGKTADSFSVSLVQYTQEHTNLIARKPGDRINLETDIIARYVEQFVSGQGSNANG